jgi:hypothetical protein
MVIGSDGTGIKNNMVIIVMIMCRYNATLIYPAKLE